MAKDSNRNAPSGVAVQRMVRRPVVALGYQAKDGTIVVTDVLCMNFPDMTNEEMAKLSWQLDQWSRNFRR